MQSGGHRARPSVPTRDRWVLGGVGYWIAQQKRRNEIEGCALGYLLGPIGWFIGAVLPTVR